MTRFIEGRSARALSGLLLGAGLAAIAAVLARSSPEAVAETRAAYSDDALPAGIDSLTSLHDAARQTATCVGCVGVVYAWTPRMPLSRSGIPAIADAAQALGIDLTLVGADELQAYATGELGSARLDLADALLAAGVLAHAPALVVHRGGRLVGGAILGYKTSDAYRSLIAGVLSGESPVGTIGAPPWSAVDFPADPRRAADHLAVGVPGAYFRWVPGRGAIAYESRRRIYLLDLADGLSRVAPGYIDFVPTPDGRFFVTPAPGDAGLTFYEADEVFEATREERPQSVEPVFTDARMRDQYPSVGILESAGERTRYRVLTSWFSGIVYRDYDAFIDSATGVASVRPVDQPVVPCRESALSTPIMSQDGQEVAARDESSGTTKIFRILDEGRCDEVVDLGVTTSKVAWHRGGRTLAFRIPRARSARGGADREEHGIFVYDRDDGSLTGVAGSEGASSLAFPDFVGDDSVVFLVPGQSRRDASVFRIVEGLR